MIKTKIEKGCLQKRLNLNSAVETVAREANVLKIRIFFEYFWRDSSHLYGEPKISKKILRFNAVASRSRFQLPNLG